MQGLVEVVSGQFYYIEHVLSNRCCHNRLIWYVNIGA